jgi:hypothetical protein
MTQLLVEQGFSHAPAARPSPDPSRRREGSLLCSQRSRLWEGRYSGRTQNGFRALANFHIRGTYYG